MNQGFLLKNAFIKCPCTSPLCYFSLELNRLHQNHCQKSQAFSQTNLRCTMSQTRICFLRSKIHNIWTRVGSFWGCSTWQENSSVPSWKWHHPDSFMVWQQILHTAGSAVQGAFSPCWKCNILCQSWVDGGYHSGIGLLVFSGMEKLHSRQPYNIGRAATDGLASVATFLTSDYSLTSFTPPPSPTHNIYSYLIACTSRTPPTHYRFGSPLRWASILATPCMSQHSRGCHNSGFLKRSQVESCFAGLCASSRPHQALLFANLSLACLNGALLILFCELC
jgi:hypothetical protein